MNKLYFLLGLLLVFAVSVISCTPFDGSHVPQGHMVSINLKDEVSSFEEFTYTGTKDSRGCFNVKDTNGNVGTDITSCEEPFTFVTITLPDNSCINGLVLGDPYTFEDGNNSPVVREVYTGEGGGFYYNKNAPAFVWPLLTITGNLVGISDDLNFPVIQVEGKYYMVLSGTCKY